MIIRYNPREELERTSACTIWYREEEKDVFILQKGEKPHPNSHYLGTFEDFFKGIILEKFKEHHNSEVLDWVENHPDYIRWKEASDVAEYPEYIEHVE